MKTAQQWIAEALIEHKPNTGHNLNNPELVFCLSHREAEQTLLHLSYKCERLSNQIEEMRPLYEMGLKSQKISEAMREHVQWSDEQGDCQ